MLATLPFSLNFAHPLAEWALLAVGGWALDRGVKANKSLECKKCTPQSINRPCCSLCRHKRFLPSIHSCLVIFAF